MSETAFFLLAVPTVLAASGVLLLRNPVHCALSLVLALFLVAANYIALGAHLIAALQIIVYAGAVMVLFRFVIMLLKLQPAPGENAHVLAKIAAGLAALGFALIVGSVVGEWSATAPAPATLAPDFGTTRVVARTLFRDHVTAFELTSILLLVAVVGAVVLARRDRV